MKPKIAIAGLGNLGWNLALRLHQRGFNIKQIIASKGSKRVKIGKKMDAQFISDIKDLKDSIDLLFLCIPDDQIMDIAAKIPNKKVAIVHCSGSTPLISRVANPTGVLYPFQTFTKFFEVEWTGVPVFVESADKHLKNSLMRIGEELSETVVEASFEQRKALHLSGVIASNFSNHLLYLTKDILDQQKLDFEYLKPLMEETIRKAFKHGPAGAQTGPAKRNDRKVVKRQTEMLPSDSTLQNLYRLFSESLSEEYKK